MQQDEFEQLEKVLAENRPEPPKVGENEKRLIFRAVMADIVPKRKGRVLPYALALAASVLVGIGIYWRNGNQEMADVVLAENEILNEEFVIDSYSVIYVDPEADADAE